MAGSASLLHADLEQLAPAVEDIDRRGGAEIRDHQRHRRRIALPVAGDSLGLPPDVVAYLDLLRKRGATEEMIAPERDAWILMAARWPDLIPAMMADKISHLEDRWAVRLYGLFGKIASEWDAGERRPSPPRRGRGSSPHAPAGS